jgi:hypothetical protein
MIALAHTTASAGLRHPGEQVEFPVAERVVHQRPPLLRRQVGRADQVKNRNMLGVRTRNSTYRGEFAHPVRGAYRADAAHPGIPISGVAGIELVAASDPIDRRVLDDRVIDGKRVIPGDAEDVVDTNLVEPPQHVLNDGFSHEVFSSDPPMGTSAKRPAFAAELTGSNPLLELQKCGLTCRLVCWRRLITLAPSPQTRSRRLDPPIAAPTCGFSDMSVPISQCRC